MRSCLAQRGWAGEDRRGGSVAERRGRVRPGMARQASFGELRLGESGHGRQVWARQGWFSLGAAWQAGFGSFWLCSVSRVRQACQGEVWSGQAGNGKAGEAGMVTFWRVQVWQGWARQARHVEASTGSAWCGRARFGRHGKTSQGLASRGRVRSVWFPRGAVRQAGIGKASCGLAGRVKAGRAWHIKAGIVGASRGSFHSSTKEDYMSTKQMAIQWKPGSCFKIDAETAHAEIERIRTQHGGELTAGNVVAEAKDKSNPLHKEFEWNDKKAAHEHRLEVARRMIRSIAIIREESKGETPQRVYEITRIKVEEQKPRNVYKTTEEIMADPETRAELLSRALRELVAIRAKYRHLQELAIVFRSVEEVLETVEA